MAVCVMVINETNGVKHLFVELVRTSTPTSTSASTRIQNRTHAHIRTSPSDRCYLSR